MVTKSSRQHNTRRPKWYPLLEQARAYHAMDFNVLPVRGKRPARDPQTRKPYEWQRWQTERQTVVDVDQMPWRNATGIAAICGEVSGNLVCFDLDGIRGIESSHFIEPTHIEAMLDALGLPPDYSWVVTTPGKGGGNHVWVRSDTATIATLNGKGKAERPGFIWGNIELRYTGHYVLLPPSKHPKARGKRYQWRSKKPPHAPTICCGVDIETTFDLITIDNDPPPNDPPRNPGNGGPPKQLPLSLNGIALDYALYIEQHAQQAYGFSEKNAKDFSRLLRCPNPAHEDQHPSAAWNYQNHSLHCKSCGWGSRDDVAEHLGLMTFDEFVAERCVTEDIPSEKPAPVTTQDVEPAPSRDDNETPATVGKPAYTKPRAVPMLNDRTRLWHLTDELRTKFLTMSSRETWFKVTVNGQTRKIMPDGGPGWMVLEIIVMAEHDQLIAPGATVFHDAIKVLAAHYGRNYTDHTIRTGIKWLVQSSILRVGSKIFMAGLDFDPIQKIENSGNRKPTPYILPDMGEALRDFWATVRDHALRVAAFGDSIPDDYHAHWGIDDEVVKAGNARRAMKIEQSEDRKTALDEIDRRFKFLSWKYGETNQRKQPVAQMIPHGTETPNASRYRDEIDNLRFPDNGIRTEADYKTLNETGFNSRGALRRSRQRRRIATDEQWQTVKIDEVPDAVKARGWGYAERADGTAMVQTASRERPMTPDEIAALERQKQRERDRAKAAAKAKRQREKAQSELPKPEPASVPPEPEGAVNADPAWYIKAQCLLSFPDDYGTSRGDIISETTGELWPGTIENYARAGAGLELIPEPTRDLDELLEYCITDLGGVLIEESEYERENLSRRVVVEGNPRR